MRPRYCLLLLVLTAPALLRRASGLAVALRAATVGPALGSSGTRGPMAISSVRRRMGGLFGSRPPVVGLVGGIASGKSTVSRILGECGAAVIDADKLGHESYEPGTACHRKLVAAFGGTIVADDGTIDRRKLGGLVFGNPDNMQRLQGIVWPEIRGMAQERIALHVREGAECIVLEAAVMLEAGWNDMVDELWVIQASPSVARERLMLRNSCTAEDADKRLVSQMSNKQRAAFADVLLANDGALAGLEKKVRDLWDERKRGAWREGRRRRQNGRLSLAAAATGAAAVLALVLLRLARPK